MGDRFLEMIRFVVENLGDLKSCALYNDEYANIELTTPDGKILKISMKAEEDKTNA